MSDTWAFDSSTGSITQCSVPRQAWVLCAHLRAPLTRLLESGSHLVGVTTSWTQTDLAVTLDAGPPLASVLPLLGPVATDVSPWSNDDTHYPVEFGILCRSCRQTLSWPQATSARPSSTAARSS